MSKLNFTKLCFEWKKGYMMIKKVIALLQDPNSLS